MNSMHLLPNTDEEIMDTHDEDIIITTREGKIIKVTHISGEHYGMSPSELLGKSVLDLQAQGIFSPAITPEVVNKRKKIVTVQMTPSGRKVLITGIPLFNEKREVEFVISYSYELSELIVMKEYLQDLETEMSKVKEELAHLRDQHIQIDGSIMESQSSAYAIKTALKVARIDASVVIQGEHGVGKTSLAKFIHSQSRQREGAFIEVNCSTIPDAIIETAFTGRPDSNSQGYLSLASGGSLVLKEIDQLSLASQSILFHLLNNQTNTRIIAVSETPLDEIVNQGKFRKDLFYILHIASIYLKPLRERPEDLEKAISLYLQELNEKYQYKKKLADDVYIHLLQLEWKGNFRELKNVMERLVIGSETNIITLQDLPLQYQPSEGEQIGIELDGQTLPHILEFVEKKVMLNTQKRYKTTTEMAHALGISQPSVVRKLKKYSSAPLGDEIE
ncbi:sigma 54-interacting transcriptional regulator [Psychrobacillus sp. FSL H8-0484]|uniref:sigma 54-interacting transcriptional regulator n=1 Tax=Psychrobacillus sp. FSL H8-0484 TaxID=2921390 RepID=UPI0030F509BB